MIKQFTGQMHAFDNYARTVQAQPIAPSSQRKATSRPAPEDTDRLSMPATHDWRQSHFVWIG
jgi:hypothetical protein